MNRFEVAIVGTGIAGLATAYELAVRHGLRRIALIDRGEPMWLTTSKSGENYRDYWPQACMTAFVTRSLDKLEQLAHDTGRDFDVRPFGYAFVSASAERDVFGPLEATSQVTREVGRAAVAEAYPYLAEDIEQVVTVVRAGAFDVAAVGGAMLAEAEARGTERLRGTVEAIDPSGDGFSLRLAGDGGGDGSTVEADRLVLAAGPFLDRLAAMLGVALPVESFLQRKFVIPDPAGVVPRDMPFTIFADGQQLEWNEEERALLSEDAEDRWLLDGFPAGLHVKPEARDQVKLGWAYNRTASSPLWQPGDDPMFANVVLRGASRFLPGLRRYVDAIPTPLVGYAGYYTRTSENWPLIGPLPVEGAYVVGALSGYGTMSACAAGELCAAWMQGTERPDYAQTFHPSRHRDPAVAAQLTELASDGQL